MRRRSTVRTRPASCSFVFTRDQYVVFDAWFRDDLKDGALRFAYVHPVTGEPGQWTFDGEPQMTATTNRKVRVSVQIRKVA